MYERYHSGMYVCVMYPETVLHVSRDRATCIQGPCYMDPETVLLVSRDRATCSTLSYRAEAISA